MIRLFHGRSPGQLAGGQKFAIICDAKKSKNNYIRLKGITLGVNSDKALTDTSKFVFGLTFRPLFQGLPQRI